MAKKKKALKGLKKAILIIEGKPLRLDSAYYRKEDIAELLEIFRSKAVG